MFTFLKLNDKNVIILFPVFPAGPKTRTPKPRHKLSGEFCVRLRPFQLLHSIFMTRLGQCCIIKEFYSSCRTSWVLNTDLSSPLFSLHLFPLSPVSSSDLRPAVFPSILPRRLPFIFLTKLLPDIFSLSTGFKFSECIRMLCISCLSLSVLT